MLESITQHVKSYIREVYKNGKWILAIGVTAIIISMLIGLYFPPIEILDSGIHEFGHAFAAAFTGGKVNWINITANSEGKNWLLGNNSLDMRMATTNTSGGNPLIILTGGVTFSLIISCLIAKAPIIRWYAPIMGGRNLLVLIPFTGTDGFQIYTNYGLFVFLIVVIINIALYIIALNSFVKLNLIAELIRKKRIENISEGAQIEN